jgi:hypothetical protein
MAGRNIFPIRPPAFKYWERTKPTWSVKPRAGILLFANFFQTFKKQTYIGYHGIMVGRASVA